MKNQLYNENCLDTMKRMPENYIDLVVTSPPYDNLRKYDESSGWQDREWEETYKAIIKELYRVMAKGGVVVWVVNDATINGSESGTSFKQCLWAKECGFNIHDTMIYLKRNAPPLTHNRYEQKFEYMFVWSKGKPKTFNPIRIPLKTQGKTHYTVKANAKNRRYDNDAIRVREKDEVKEKKKTRIDDNVWLLTAGKNYGVGNEHSAIFPEELVSRHITSWSAADDIVYDPFLGAGTTTKIAKVMGRNWIGSEISEEFYKVASKRMEESGTGDYQVEFNEDKRKNFFGDSGDVDVDALVKGEYIETED